MGRPRNKIPRLRQSIPLRADLVASINVLFSDPARNKIRYGSWTDLVEPLLWEWLQTQHVGKEPPVKRDKVEIALNVLNTAAPSSAVDTAKKLLEEAL